jgi:tetratricopeptide (TPR) repeat protein
MVIRFVRSQLLGRAFSAENRTTMKRPLALAALLLASTVVRADDYDDGRRLYGAKRDREAAEAFTRAIAANPRRAEAYVGRGLARYALRDYAGALADDEAAIRIDPYLEDAYIYRGKAYIALGKIDRGIDDFTAATRVRPESGRGWYERGLAIHRHYVNRPAAALHDLDEAIRREPRNPHYYNLRGSMRLNSEDVEGSLADLGRAIELAPKMAVAYGNRGIAHFWAGNRKAAQADFDRALALDPSLRGAIETNVESIPAIQQWIVDYRRMIAEAAASARSSGSVGCTTYTGHAKFYCESHGATATDDAIRRGDFSR